MAAEKQLTLTTPDNVVLAGTLFEAAHSNGRVVLLSSAMGVKRRYYAKYAAFLAEQGFHVVTYDYRGIGDSRQGSLRGFPARLRDWSVIDQSAWTNWIIAQYPDHLLLIVGHSLGGQIPGLNEQAARIRAVLGIASQSGYWRNWSGIWRWLILTLWTVVVPTVCAVFGYLPGRLLGAAESVPGGVALDWAAGGRSPNYILRLFGGTKDDHYGQITAPLRLYSFEDDTYAPRATVAALLAFYPAAQREHIHVAPGDVGVPGIGHFGFFRSAFASTLWLDTAHWLKQV